MVAAIERIKYAFLLKLSVRYIPSDKNTADSLSRARVPLWLQRRGTRILPSMSALVHLIDRRNLVTSWISSLNNYAFYSDITSQSTYMSAGWDVKKKSKYMLIKIWRYYGLFDETSKII